MSGKQFRLSMAVLVAALILAASNDARTQQGPTQYVISQRGRAFNPNFLSIKQGDTVRIVNDDGDLLHHAYVESDTFNFDFRRSIARQQDRRRLFSPRPIQRALRHSSENEARRRREVTMAKKAPRISRSFSQDGFCAWPQAICVP